MAQTTSLVFNGGAIPSPAPTPSGSGKAKLLKIGEITITEQGEQVTKKVICDPDSVTTVAPFMEVLTSAKLAELVEANNIIVLDDGDMQYLMADANITVEEGISVCTAVNFLGLSKENRAKVAYECTRITDELTLQQVVEVGEPVETNFNLVISDSEDTAPDTLIDKMDVVDAFHDPDDPDSPPMLLQFGTIEDGQGKRKVAIDESELTNELKSIWDNTLFIEDQLGELPSDEHGYFNSSLVQTPGDGTTTNIVIDDFRISENRDVHGDSIEFVPTHQEGGIDFGEVYLEPGTYILATQFTLQWVGNPRGTFLSQVSNVADQPFDFSYEHEDVVRTTRIVTRTTRGKLVLNIAIDVDTPPIGVWVKNLEVAQIASYNHPAVVHDTTLTGKGQLGDPIGVTPAAFGKVKDIPTSISQFRTGDVIPVDGPNGPAKMGKDGLLTETAQNALAGNVAPAFDPDKVGGYKKRQFVVKDGILYRFDANHAGAWTGTDAHVADLSELSEDKYFIESNGEYAKILTDSDGNMICAITGDGDYKFFIRVSFAGGVEGFVASEIFFENDNPEYMYQIVDSEGNLICSVTRDGDFKFDCGVPHQIQKFVKSFFTNYSNGNVEIKDVGSTSWTVVGAGCDGAKHNYCSGFGYHVLRNNTGIKNVTMGSDNMENASGDDNTSMGYHSQFRLTSGNRNSSHGSESQDDVTDGKENTSIGFCSLQRNNIGDHNAVLGAYALQGIYENRFDPENLKKHFDNVAVGYKAMYNAEHLSEKNVALGMNTLGTTRKYINCIAIGYGADCDADNKAVIGNENITETKVFGDLVVNGTDNVKRRVVFNNDGTCSWTALT